MRVAYCGPVGADSPTPRRNHPPARKQQLESIIRANFLGRFESHACEQHGAVRTDSTVATGLVRRGTRRGELDRQRHFKDFPLDIPPELTTGFCQHLGGQLVFTPFVMPPGPRDVDIAATRRK